jgi:hypothetical protein
VVSDFSPIPLLLQQLHGGLEAIDIQAQRSVEFRQLTVGAFSNEAIVHHLAHNRSILLLHKTLIVFQRRASPRERSSNVRIGICCLSNVPARVVERPCCPSVRCERRRRSAVAALMESNCLRHSCERWRCPCRSSASIRVGRKGMSRLAQMPPGSTTLDYPRQVTTASNASTGPSSHLLTPVISSANRSLYPSLCLWRTPHALFLSQ